MALCNSKASETPNAPGTRTPQHKPDQGIKTEKIIQKKQKQLWNETEYMSAERSERLLLNSLEKKTYLVHGQGQKITAASTGENEGEEDTAMRTAGGGGKETKRKTRQKARKTREEVEEKFIRCYLL